MTSTIWAGLAAMAFIGPGACQTTRLVSDYDPALDAGLEAQHAAAVQLTDTLSADLADDAAAPYADYAERYAGLHAQLSTLEARSRLSDPGAAARACTLPSALASRIEAAADGAEAPAGVSAAGADEDADAAGCTARLLGHALEGFSRFRDFHYCATVERPEAVGPARSWDARCPDGAVMLNETSLASARRAWIKPIEYAWTVELAKKPDGAGS